MSAPPRTIRYLAAYGSKALQPSFSKGKYMGPLVSTRKASIIRKQALEQGLYGNFDSVKGRGWDPKWDEMKVKKMYFLRPHRGHLRERTRPERAAKITKAMEAMPDRIVKYEQEVKDRRPKKDILSMFARVARISKTKVQQSGPQSQSSSKAKSTGGKKKK